METAVTPTLTLESQRTRDGLKQLLQLHCKFIISMFLIYDDKHFHLKKLRALLFLIALLYFFIPFTFNVFTT